MCCDDVVDYAASGAQTELAETAACCEFRNREFSYVGPRLVWYEENRE